MRFDNDFILSDLQVHFPSVQTLGQLNSFSNSTGVKYTLESKDYSAVDMVLPFIAAFIDLVI